MRASLTSSIRGFRCLDMCLEKASHAEHSTTRALASPASTSNLCALAAAPDSTRCALASPSTLRARASQAEPASALRFLCPFGLHLSTTLSSFCPSAICAARA